ncbi:MAG: glutathione synthetase [Saprospiraceae bacterium]|nr:glutathione synthetase [Saprospiraceae bacterium]MDG2418973.1 glutathione synthetase [Saprospiraceae bacterium]
MQTFKVLVLTDHTNHSAENSMYAMLQSMIRHPGPSQVDIATRANESNDFFFKNFMDKKLSVCKVDVYFAFSPEGKSFQKMVRKESLHNYDVVWLRIPPPLPKPFLIFLKHKFPQIIFINDPDGIYETGSKEFVLNFPEVCPPMKLCQSVEDILAFGNQFPIVLKPLREYGGKGIVKIDGEKVWEGKTETSLSDFLLKIKNSNIEYLAVKFLKNVSQGDKRIVVVNGKIIGSSLRLPAKDSWLCNVAMGGNSVSAEVDDDEIKIVERINPMLSKLGIVMYGVDTLVDDDGKRVLSEINITSIGGVIQMERQQGASLVKRTTNRICDFIKKKIKEKNAISN